MLNHAIAIWRLRDFLLALVWLDFKKRYNRSWLGVGWMFLHPVAMATTYLVVFSGVLGVSPTAYATTVLVGLAVWAFLSESAVGGCMAIVSHESYIRQHDLPHALFALRLVLGYGIHGLLALGVALVGVVVLTGSTNVVGLLWAVVPALAMILVAGWALATTFAYAQVLFHDTKHLLEVASQILFFLTPIIYPPSLLVGKGLGWMARLNPANVYLELVRYPLTAGELPPAKLYLIGLVCTAALVAVAVLMTSIFQKKIIYRL